MNYRDLEREGFGRLSGGELWASNLNESVSVVMGKQQLDIVARDDPFLDDYPRVSNKIGALIVHKDTFSIEKNTGFKALRGGIGGDVVLGRNSPYRFEALASDDTASRHHARFEYRINDNMPQLVVTDLESTNGTWVRKGGLDIPARYAAQERDAPRSSGVSLASDRHPDSNEDAWFVASDARSLGVFDGVGSREGSARAAQTAAQAVESVLRGTPDGLPPSLAKMRLNEAIISAHNAIRRTTPDVLTTATVAKVFSEEPGKQYAAIASVGDSRAYLLRDSSLTMLTLDHGFTTNLSESEQWRLQATLSEVKDVSSLTPQERAAFNNRNFISSALGGDDDKLIVATRIVDVQAGDMLILTTDGVHDNLTTSEMQAIVSSTNGDAEQTTTFLTRAAQHKSRNGTGRAKPDDITATVLAI